MLRELEINFSIFTDLAKIMDSSFSFFSQTSPELLFKSKTNFLLKFPWKRLERVGELDGYFDYERWITIKAFTLIQ